MSNKDNQDMFEAGSYLVECLNKMPVEDRKRFLRANVGSIINLTRVSIEDKVRILKELIKEISGKKDENPRYIG